jgi:hypothetical protein
MPTNSYLRRVERNEMAKHTTAEAERLADPRGAPVGLTNTEGNHGEDVKEQLLPPRQHPTHSYMKSLYKYPQAAFPYQAALGTYHGVLRRGCPADAKKRLDVGKAAAFDVRGMSSAFPNHETRSVEDGCVTPHAGRPARGGLALAARVEALAFTFA